MGSSSQNIRDRYVLGEKIGQGSFGVVYHATDRLKKRDVALKVLLPQFAEKDLARQRAMSLYKRWHELAQIGLGEDDAAPAENRIELPYIDINEIEEVSTLNGVRMFVSMPPAQTSMENWMAGLPNSAPSQALIKIGLEFIYQLANGLAVFHRNNLVHEGIHSRNILLFEKPSAAQQNKHVAKFADFGVLKLLR
ncbi:MAG: protein kinase, partial [Chloroflexota bacterium]